jgi:hypothetical protein
MRSIFLSLVLGAAALGIMAVPSSAQARPAHACVVNRHYAHRGQHHWRYAHYRWWNVHHYCHR